MNEKVALATILAKRTLYEQVGDYNTNYLKISDFEWITRVNELGISSIILDEVLLKRRIHGQNLTIQNTEDTSKLRFQILKESMDRKRKNEN